MTADYDEGSSKHTTRADEIDKYVGQRLRQKRVAAGLSQQALGDVVGVSIQQIQKYEKATNRVAAGKLYKLAELLREPVTYFFEGLDIHAKRASNFAESQEEFADKDGVKEREVLSLVRSYNEISNPHVRKKILDLVKTLSAG